MVHDRRRTLTLAAAGGMLASLGCHGAATSPTAAAVAMPEYPPSGDKADGGAARAAAAPPDAQNADPEAQETARARVAVRQKPSKDCCKGRNDCKGKGWCKTDKNACKGRNQCKGQGGCKPAVCP